MISSSELSLIRFKPPKMISFLIRVHNYNTDHHVTHPSSPLGGVFEQNLRGDLQMCVFQSTYQNTFSRRIFPKNKMRIENDTVCMSHVTGKSRDHQMCGLFSKQLLKHSTIATCSIIKQFCCHALVAPESIPWHVNIFHFI